MMKDIDIDKAIASLEHLKTTQSVAFRFDKRTGLTGLMCLHALMDENPTVKVSCVDKTRMDAVMSTQQWRATRNRVYHASGFYFVEEKKLRDMLKYVDALYVDNIGIEGMMSKEVNIRKKVVERISNAVFTPNFIKKINECGFNPQVYLSKLMNGTPSLQTDLFMDGCVAISLTLDGFSGRIAINNTFGDDMYVAPGQFQQVVMNAIEHDVVSVTGIK